MVGLRAASALTSRPSVFYRARSRRCHGGHLQMLDGNEGMALSLCAHGQIAVSPHTGKAHGVQAFSAASR